jgi:hypothetical protein
MPLCAEFLDDDKDVPYGHGLTGHIKNMPVFEDSVQVGSFEDWSIEDVEIDGEIHRCLCATGYINEGRYPKFVKWIEDQLANGKKLRGSVEFVGTKDNDGEIIYDRYKVIFKFFCFCKNEDRCIWVFLFRLNVIYRMSHFQQSSCNSRNKNRLVFNSSCSYHLHIIFLSHSVLGLGLELEPEDCDCIVFSFVGLSTEVLPPLSSSELLSLPLIVYDVA